MIPHSPHVTYFPPYKELSSWNKPKLPGEVATHRKARLASDSFVIRDCLEECGKLEILWGRPSEYDSRYYYSRNM